MRILFWSDFFPPAIGGVERGAGILVGELAARGHELMVISTRVDETLPAEANWQGIPVHRFPFVTTLRQGDLAGWRRQQDRALALINAFQPDLYHAYGAIGSIPTLLQICKKKALPLLVRLIATATAPAQIFAGDSPTTRILTAATWVTAVSQATLDQALAYLPALRDTSSVLYNGHPTPPLPPAALPTEGRLLFLGRLTEQKGCDVAIAAFAEVRQRYPEARLIIAGDGSERPRLEALAAGLGAAVEFLGWYPPDQVHALINSATCVLIPSNWEGLPNVAIEAAYMARPTVAANIPGMAEVILAGKTGLLVEPRNPHALAAAMVYLLDHPGEAHAMGQAARAWANQRFTLARWADEHELLYTRLGERFRTVHSAPHIPQEPESEQG